MSQLFSCLFCVLITKKANRSHFVTSLGCRLTALNYMLLPMVTPDHNSPPEISRPEAVSLPLVLESEADLPEFLHKWKDHYQIGSTSNQRIDQWEDVRRIQRLKIAIQEGKVICLGVKSGEQLVGITKVDISDTKDGREAYLGALHVDERFRGGEKDGVIYRDEHGDAKTLATQLVEKALSKSRETGCQKIVAEVLVENRDGAKSIGTLLKSGFILERFNDPEDKFYLVKQLAGEEGNRVFTQEERVSFADMEIVKEKLAAGWQGTQMLRQGNEFVLVLQK